MSLNVNLEDVPWKILEAVKARILRNRRNLKDNQQQIQRPMLQPKPQIRKQGADSKTWTKPEPAAILDSGGEAIGMAWVAYRQLGFSAGSYWSNGPGVSGLDGTIQYVSRDDQYRMKVGSGDGKQWIDLTFNLPGINAWRTAIRDGIAAGGFFRPTSELRELRDNFTGELFGIYGYQVGDYVYGFFHQRTPDDSEIIFHCLPVGLGACVLLITVRAAGSFAAKARVVTVQDFGLNPDGTPATVFGGGISWPPTDANTALVDVGQPPINSKNTKAVLITHTSCREISAPESVLAKLSIAYPDLGWDNTVVYAVDTPTGATKLAQIPSQVEGLSYTETYSYTAGGQSRTGQVGRRKISQLYGLGSYGFNSYLMADTTIGQLTGGIDSSPAAFALLNKPVELAGDIDFADAGAINAVFASYDSMRAQLAGASFNTLPKIATLDGRPEAIKQFEEYFNGDNVPGFTGNAAYADPGDLLSRIFFASYRLASSVLPGDTILQNDSRWQRLNNLSFAKPRVDIYDGLNADQQSLYQDQIPFFFTDWGQPGFCRQQVLALGFSAADLQP